MKNCIKCKIEKPLSDFYKHPQMADGHLGKCKECCKEDENNRRRANIDAIREYDRRRSMEPHRVAARYLYQRTDRGRAACDRAKRSWIEKNPRKRAAQILFRNRSRYDSSLAKKPCERCGAVNTHAHHENYDRPLDVVWLCPFHHKQRHKEMKKEGIEP